MLSPSRLNSFAALTGKTQHQQTLVPQKKKQNTVLPCPKGLSSEVLFGPQVTQTGLNQGLGLNWGVADGPPTLPGQPGGEGMGSVGVTIGVAPQAWGGTRKVASACKPHSTEEETEATG